MITIKLKGKNGNGKFLIADNEDEELLRSFDWYPDSTGYPRSQRNKSAVYAHRLIAGATTTEYVDHRNGDILDCRRSNLRKCTNSQNMYNRGKTRHNTSGYKGVNFFRPKGLWRAQIRCDGKFYSMYFRTPEEAAGAYNTMALELHGQFARIN